MSHIIELTLPAWKLALQGLGKIIDKRATLPVLSNILAQREGGRLSLQVTDLDRFLTHHPVGESAGADIQFLVPLKPLQQAVKDADRDSVVRLVCQGDAEVLIESVVTGQQLSQRHETPLLKDWPALPAVTAQAIPVADGFKSALQQALECSSRDESRHVLRGACLDTTDQGDYVVGTDGRHLYAANSFRFPQRQPVIIPAHKFLSWKGFAEDGEWQLGMQTGKDPSEITNILLQSPQWTYVTSPIEGAYPNWHQVVPKGKAQATITLADESVAWFKSTLAKLPVADASTKALLFEASGQQLHVRSNAADGGVDLIVPGVEVSGSDVCVALNRDMVLKAIKFGFKTLAVNDSLDPVRFSAPGRQMVVMPVRGAAPASTATASQKTEPAPNDRINTPNPTNERKNTMSATTTSPLNGDSKTGLQAAVEQVEQLRDQVRQINGGLGEALRTLKDAAKEQRTSEREVNTIRNRLRSLQSVEI